MSKPYRKSTVRVAVVQAASVAFNVEASLQKLESYADEAAKKDAELVLFPEGFISGYMRGASFGWSIGNRTMQGRDQFVPYFESAIEIPGPEVSRISQVARKNKVQLVVGVTERDGGTLYCTALFFGSDGSLLGKRRKLLPTGLERLVWGSGDGSTLQVFDTPLGKISAAICWENYMPLLRTALYAQGVQIWCAPTAGWSDQWVRTMQHVAFEGRCFVLSANQFVRRSDFPEDYQCEISDDPSAILSYGGSCVIDPYGEFIVPPQREGEAVLIADLEMSSITKGRLDFDAVGHYSRPDVFQLRVNTKKQQTVVLNCEDNSSVFKAEPNLPATTD